MKTKFLQIAAILLIACLFSSLRIQASGVNGDTIPLMQPDQSWVKVVTWGDEYYQHIESIDRYTLIRDAKTNWICYAQMNAERNEFVSTGVVYRGQKFADNFSEKEISEAEKSTLAALPKSIKLPNAIVEQQIEAAYKKMHKNDTENEPKTLSNEADRLTSTVDSILGLTILIDFSDQPASFSREEIRDMMIKPGYNGFGNNGSVRDYFKDVSKGKVIYTNIVIGYYRPKYPKSYYDNANFSVGGAREDTLLKEIFTLLKTLSTMPGDPAGFSRLSRKGTGSGLRAVNILYAGDPAAGFSKGLWSHPGIASDVPIYDNSSYMISHIGTSPSIGTICHESGHMLFGWPDLYDRDFDSKGLGNYCLMAVGDFDKNPVPPNAHLRDGENWETVITEEAPTCQGFRIRANSNTSVEYTNPAKSRERYYFGTVRKVGRSANMPDEGLMVLHVDETVLNNVSPSHYRVALIQADGQKDLERNINNGDGGDLFKWGQVATLDQTKWWNGTQSGLTISNVYAPANDLMNFTFDVCLRLNTRDDSETNQDPITIYPNPSNGEITINLLESEPAATAHLYDLAGKQVYETKLNNLSNTIDISALENGTYIVKVIAEKETFHYKLFKQ